MISKIEQREVINDIIKAYDLLKDLLIFIEEDALDLEQKIQLKDIVEFVEYKFDNILQKVTSNEVGVFLRENIVVFLDDMLSVLLKFRTLIANV